MSTVTTFGGRTYTEPGVAARVINGTPTAPLDASAGTVLLLDTGSGAGFGAGSGVNGELLQGKQALLKFDQLSDAQAALRGGLLYDLVSYLFNPNPDGSDDSPDDTKGIERLLYLRAATTTAPVITTNIGADVLKYKPRTEGTGANGVLVGQKLTRGYGARVAAGIVDPTKVLVRFYVGGYAGQDPNGVPYNGFAEADSTMSQIGQSPEFSTTAALAKWMATNKAFTDQFYYDAVGSSVSSTPITQAQITAAVGWDLAVGGTEVYDLDQVHAALDALVEEEHTYILSDCLGTDALTGTVGTINQTLVASLVDANFPKFVVIAGGSTGADFAGGFGLSNQAAAGYDSPGVIVVDGGCQVAGPNSSYGLLARSALYTAATVLGRKCGLDPAEPVTHKRLSRLKGLTNELGKTDRIRALQGGVLHLKAQGSDIVVNQGINTLQLNTRLINPDGHSHDWAVEAIDSALVNRLQTQATKRFVGKTRAAATETDVITWTQNFLQEQIKEGLILSYQSVTAKLVDDAWFVEFGYVTNGPINKVFFTAAKV